MQQQQIGRCQSGAGPQPRDAAGDVVEVVRRRGGAAGGRQRQDVGGGEHAGQAARRRLPSNPPRFSRPTASGRFGIQAEGNGLRPGCCSPCSGQSPSGSRSPSQSSQLSRRVSRGAVMRRRSSSSNSSVATCDRALALVVAVRGAVHDWGFDDAGARWHCLPPLLAAPQERVLKFRVAGHPRTDGVELRLLQSWGSGRTPSWFTTIWAA
jgi:hypothetical protein